MQEESRKGLGLLNFCFVVGCTLVLVEYLLLTAGISLNDPNFHSQRTAPLGRKLLWIDVDALRADFAFDPAVMPALASLASHGASGTTQCSGITASLPALKAWATGVGFNTKDFVRNFWGLDPNADSIFQRARLKQMRVEFSGPPEWVRSFKPHFNDYYTVETPDIFTDDRQVQAHALQFIEKGDFNILVMHYENADMVEHTYGCRDGHYAMALRQIDSYIRELMDRAPEGLTILVAGDHGASDEGGHFASTPEVTRPPFVLAGPAINHVSGVALRQIDVAPTLCALLGIDYPSQSEGTLALSLLRASPADKANWEMAYASSHLHALELAGLKLKGGDQQRLTQDYEAVQAALAAGRPTEAISMAEDLESRSNTLLQQLVWRRSNKFFALVLGLGLCGFAALLSVGRRRGVESLLGEPVSNSGHPLPRLSPALALFMLAVGLGAIWVVGSRYAGPSEYKIWPFSYPFLQKNWARIALVVCGLPLALAVLTSKGRLPRLSQRWQILIFGCLSALLIGSWQVYELTLWAALVAVLVFFWKAVLFHRARLPEVLLYGGMIPAVLFTRVVHRFGQHFGPRLPVLLSLFAILSIAGAATASVWFLSPRKRAGAASPIGAAGWNTVPVAVWLLWALALTAQVARLFQWGKAEIPLLTAIGLALAWQMLAARSAEALLLGVSAAILALCPVLFPPQYVPLLATALLAFGLTARRLCEQERPSAFTLSILGIATMLFLFFALSGSFDLDIIDTKRWQILDPSFAYDYRSVGRIALLMLLQFLLPAMIVVGWLGYGLRKQRAVWLRMNAWMHLFFLVGIVTVAIHLRYASGGFNALAWNLSEFVALFLMYASLHIATHATNPLFHLPPSPREAVDGDAAPICAPVVDVRDETQGDALPATHERT